MAKLESGCVYPEPIRPGRTRVGWVGVGVMGAAMAARVQSAGYALAVHARTPAKALPLQRGGARLAPTPADVARCSDVVFIMVSHPSDVHTVVLDPATGVLSALPKNGVLVDCTSSSPTLAREVAAAAHGRGCWAVDAPVSGGDAGAREGRLAILAGGEEHIIEWLSPLFELMGKVTRMGGPGCGQSSKIANQIVVGANLLGLSEALVFAETSGLNKKAFLEALKEGAAGSAVMELFGERIVGRDFEPGAYSEYMVKDLGMGLDAGDGEEGEESSALVMPGAALCRQMFLAMAANGDGKMGMQGLITVIERINGKHSV